MAFNCKQCSLVFKYHYQLIMHTFLHSNISDRNVNKENESFQCELYGLFLINVDHFKNHAAQHTEGIINTEIGNFKNTKLYSLQNRNLYAVIVTSASKRKRVTFITLEIVLYILTSVPCVPKRFRAKNVYNDISKCTLGVKRLCKL